MNTSYYWDVLNEVLVELDLFRCLIDIISVGALLLFAHLVRRPASKKEKPKAFAQQAQACRAHRLQKELQNYKFQIHNAAASKDVTRAVTLFDQLKRSSLQLDSGVYNCLLHAFVSVEDFDRARSLMDEMTQLGLLNTVSCNTMLKGYAAANDVVSCNALFAQLKALGLQADAISYNCLLHTVGISGDLRQAWRLLAEMREAGVKPDEYTVCILFMVMQQCRCTPQDVNRAFLLPQTLGIDLGANAVLLSVAIKTCIQHNEASRLEALLHGWERSSMQPRQRVYVSLIKAYTYLQNVDRCKSLWHQMTVERGMEPNCIVLGSMINALVCASLVSEAYALFQEWRDVARSNMVIYATLLRGMAVQGWVQEAMSLFQEIRAEPGAVLGVRLYNPLLDAQARVGNIDEVRQLMETMKADGVEPDSTSYAILIKGYCASGKFTEAVGAVCNGSVAVGNMANCGVYNTVLDACVRARKDDLVDQLLADFEAKGIVASNFTLGILAKTYGQRHQLKRAFSVVRNAQKEHNLPFNILLETCLMSACFFNADVTQAMQVFEDMKANVGDGLLDSKAFGVAIYGCVRLGHTQQAVHLVEEAYGLRGGKRMLLRHQALHARDMSALAKALDQRNQHEQARELCEKLQAAGVPIDEQVFAFAYQEQGTWGETPSAPAQLPSHMQTRFLHVAPRSKAESWGYAAAVGPKSDARSISSSTTADSVTEL